MVQEYIQFTKEIKMRLFVYKTLFLGFIIFIIFHATIGFVLKNYEAKIMNLLSKDNINYIKDKLRSEIKDGLEKDQILSQEDVILVNKLLLKIKKELNDTK